MNLMKEKSTRQNARLQLKKRNQQLPYDIRINNK